MRAAGIYVWSCSGDLVRVGRIASMITALNLAYQMEETRSWFKIRSTAIVLTLVMCALLVMALLLVLVSGDVFDSIGSGCGWGRWLWSWGRFFNGRRRLCL